MFYVIISLQIEEAMLVIGAGQHYYTGVLPLDETVGLNTRLIFIYSHDINVTITTSGNHNVQITKNTDLKYILAIVEGSAVSSQNPKSKYTLLNYFIIATF